ncbi:MAG: Re/Si-specific NAD(P)(+) transhydrogenase subunit alpha [Gemmatimonadaceae bacterium]|nr:Re/Si-specific NAD(P)(+) transhydrogenase subunit alpha [Gemmatimonadaceae bacterium]
MRIAVPLERTPGEQRVALVPDNVARLVKAGATVIVEQGAGVRAGASDDDYVKAGAELAPDAATATRGATIVAKVQRPLAEEVALIPEGGILVSLVQAHTAGALLDALNARRVTVLALERVPRITRAQSMDVLSSQATVAGYKAVLLAANALPRLMPALTTAAGSLKPANAFILGAGVAGLQAIATARRLGAIVSAFDVRAAAREQVQSLGAKFVGNELVSPGAEVAGGYAREQGADEQQRTLAAIGAVLPQMDLVISTAAIPGRAAPRLITADMVKTMKPGSVIVDISAETGGNCELTQPGETIIAHGVQVMGPLNLPSTMPVHASQMFGRNMLTFVQHLMDKEGQLTLDLADEITGAMAVAHDGQRR